MSLKISNASPVQFWVNDKETFNEKTVPGINKKPWYYKANRSDQIRIQVLGTDTITLIIRAYDGRDNVIGQAHFINHSGYYEAVFTCEDLGIVKGLHRFQIETPEIMSAGVGVFSLQGQDADFIGENTIIGEMGAFSLDGEEVTLTYTPYDPGELIIQGINNGPSSVFFLFSAYSTNSFTVGGGGTNASTVAYDADCDSVISKLGSGLAAGAGGAAWRVNGVVVNSIGFMAGADISNLTYTFTGLSVGDVLTVELTEGEIV